MSGTSFALGVFATPYFMVVRDGERVATSPLQEALDAPPYSSALPFMIIAPPITPPQYDASDNVIGGDVPTRGACLILVQVPTGGETPASDIINALDALPDVWRIAPNMTDAQKATIETRLREKDVMTDLSDTNDVREMAERIAAAIRPTFNGFPNGWF